MMGATKDGEYYRSIELLEKVYKEQGMYFLLALLYDMQYTRKDIKKMMDLLEPKARDEIKHGGKQ